MEERFGFTKMDLPEFEAWLRNLRVARTILFVQQHHTYTPSYSHFEGDNHFELQRGMKRHHVNNNGWRDIGQHLSTFPDGTIVTGRGMEHSPACIKGNNANSVCIEHVGNFDSGRDSLTTEHRKTVIGITAALCKRFGVPVNTDKIVYHHWFNLVTGARNNGTGGNKTCPGTGFFGGNKVPDCESNLLPHVRALVDAAGPAPSRAAIRKYATVTANSLNIRVGPAASNRKVTGRAPVALGAILRVYGERNGWYKISASKRHWVSGRYTQEVRRALINADVLNVRSGPHRSFDRLGSFRRGHEVFVQEERDNWARIATDDRWVSKRYLTMA